MATSSPKDILRIRARSITRQLKVLAARIGSKAPQHLWIENTQVLNDFLTYRAQQMATTARPTVRSHAHVINSLPAVVQEPSMHMPATREVSSRTRDATRRATLVHVNAAVARLEMEDSVEAQSGEDEITQCTLRRLAQRNYNVNKKRELASDRSERAFSKPLDKSTKRCFNCNSLATSRPNARLLPPLIAHRSGRFGAEPRRNALMSLWRRTGFLIPGRGRDPCSGGRDR